MAPGFGTAEQGRRGRLRNDVSLDAALEELCLRLQANQKQPGADGEAQDFGVDFNVETSSSVLSATGRSLVKSDSWSSGFSGFSALWPKKREAMSWIQKEEMRRQGMQKDQLKQAQASLQSSRGSRAGSAARSRPQSGYSGMTRSTAPSRSGRRGIPPPLSTTMAEVQPKSPAKSPETAPETSQDESPDVVVRRPSLLKTASIKSLPEQGATPKERTRFDLPDEEPNGEGPSSVTSTFERQSSHGSVSSKGGQTGLVRQNSVGSSRGGQTGLVRQNSVGSSRGGQTGLVRQNSVGSSRGNGVSKAGSRLGSKEGSKEKASRRSSKAGTEASSLSDSEHSDDEVEELPPPPLRGRMNQKRGSILPMRRGSGVTLLSIAEKDALRNKSEAALARELHMPLDVVKDALMIFKKNCEAFDGTNLFQVTVDMNEFGVMLCEMCQIESLDELDADFVDQAFRTADRDGSGEIDCEEFAVWYSSFSFLESVTLTKEKRKTRDLARNLGLNAVEIDKYKRLFDKYDADRSGDIGYAEFSRLVTDLLKVPAGQVMPQERLMSLWREADTDGSGELDFEEFCAFCQKRFFSGDSDGGTFQFSDFYRSVRRVPTME